MRAALIDLFDTLVWSEWRVLRGRLAEAIGVEPQVLQRAYEVTYRDRQIGANGSAEGDMAALVVACDLEPETVFVRELADLVSGHLDGHVHLYEDSLPTLRGLREGGVRTAVVSNCDHFAGPLVETIGLRDEVDAIVLSYEVGSHKPEAAIYVAALDALGAKPEQAVFVDDQPPYLDGAAALGIDTRCIHRANEPWEGHRDPGPHTSIESLTALL
jgi:HAD superfamily hydrolase (TIGR01509 family)